jgi:hypothetical protein
MESLVITGATIAMQELILQCRLEHPLKQPMGAKS